MDELEGVLIRPRSVEKFTNVIMFAYFSIFMAARFMHPFKRAPDGLRVHGGATLDRLGCAAGFFYYGCMIRLKRVYEKPATEDGFRILVDRLWPRGVSKKKASVDVWAKDIAPSDELRKWFAHDLEKWPEFQRKYRIELNENHSAVAELRKLVRAHSVVTLLYAAKDQKRNQAVVLKKILRYN